MRLMSLSQILHDNQNILQGDPFDDLLYNCLSQCIAISQNIFKVQNEVSYLSMVASRGASNACIRYGQILTHQTHLCCLELYLLF
jgi:hypothetical protein